MKSLLKAMLNKQAGNFLDKKTHREVDNGFLSREYPGLSCMRIERFQAMALLAPSVASPLIDSGGLGCCFR